MRALPAITPGPVPIHDWIVQDQHWSTSVSELQYSRPRHFDISAQLASGEIVAESQWQRSTGLTKRLVTVALPPVGPRKLYHSRPHLKGRPYLQYMPLCRGEDDIEDFSFRYRFHIPKRLADSTLVPLTSWTQFEYEDLVPHDDDNEFDDLDFDWHRGIDRITFEDLHVLKSLPELQPAAGDPPVPCLLDLIELRKAALAMAQHSCSQAKMAFPYDPSKPYPSGVPLSLAEDYRRHYAYYVALYPHAVVHHHA